MASIASSVLLLCIVGREYQVSCADLQLKLVENDQQVLQSDSTSSLVVNTNEGLEWLAAVTAQRGYPVQGVSQACLSEMREYWQGLDQQEPWASKMYDANGRYSGLYHFGNTFWLGSSILCREVKAPHFNVSFRVAKLKVTLPLKNTTVLQLVYLGLCQPDECTKEDTKMMLAKWTWRRPEATPTTSTTQVQDNNTSVVHSSHLPPQIAVIHVRKVPGEYSLLKDVRFQVICGMIALITILVLTATSYEMFILEKRAEIKKKIISGENNNGFIPEEKEVKVNEVVLKEITCEKGNKMQRSNGNVTKDERLGQEQGQGPRQPEGARALPTTTSIKYLLAFSGLSNGRQILSTKSSGDGVLTCIHGLRFFSLTWVILVHTFLQFFAVAGNRKVREVIERSVLFRTVGNATFSVDTFFFISGVLVAYLYKSNTRSNFYKQATEFITLILYRFIRLTPIYLLVLGMVQLSMAYIQNNSVFEPNIMDYRNCDDYWWRNVLYVNNFYPKDEMCMLWSWYLAVDTQFFILSALILIIGIRRIKLAASILAVTLVGAWGTTAFVAYTNRYEAKVSEPFALFDELYDKPWTRIGPYIVGMATGYFVKKTGRNLAIPIGVTMTGWTVSLALLIMLVFGLGSGLTVPLSTAYVALGHTTWGLCLAWILIACHTGHGGVINRILASPMLFPVSRLTFCAYLVHPVVMVLTSYLVDAPFHIHSGTIVIMFFGNTVASLLLSFILSLGFESPVVRLLKLAVSFN